MIKKLNKFINIKSYEEKARFYKEKFSLPEVETSLWEPQRKLIRENDWKINQWSRKFLPPILFVGYYPLKNDLL